MSGSAHVTNGGSGGMITRGVILGTSAETPKNRNLRRCAKMEKVLCGFSAYVRRNAKALNCA